MSVEHDQNIWELDLHKLKTEIQTKGKVVCPSTGCDEDFKSIWGLKYHLKNGSCQQGDKFKCEDCGEPYQTRIALQQHGLECPAQCGAGEVGAATEINRKSQPKATTLKDCDRVKSKKTRDTEVTREPMKSDLCDVNSVTPLRRSGRLRISRKEKDTDDSPSLPVSKGKRKKKQPRKKREVVLDNDDEGNDIDPAVNEDDDNSKKQNNNSTPPKKKLEHGASDESPTPPSEKQTKKRQPRTKRKSAVLENDDNDEREGIDAACEDDNSRKQKSNTIKPKRKPNSAASETEILKKRLRYGGKVPCSNACGKKFSTFAGYLLHIKMCGVPEQERDKFICEKCSKVYTTAPGLRYHLSAAHAEIVVEKEEDTNEEQDKDISTGDSPRGKRKAAQRAMEMVKKITITLGYEKISRKPGGKLNKFIRKLREHLITKEQSLAWRKDEREKLTLNCPNETCGKTFSRYNSVALHYINCGFDTAAHKCILCDQHYATIEGARYHVQNHHAKNKEVESELHQLNIERDEECRITTSDEGDEEYDAKDDSEDPDDDEYTNEDLVNDDVDDTRGSEEEPEGFVWSSHLRRFVARKSGTRLKTPVTPEDGERAGVVLFDVGQMNTAFLYATEWRKKNTIDKGLYPQYQPTLRYWAAVDARDVDEYIPAAAVSPRFRITRTGNEGTTDTQLPLFTSIAKETSGLQGDRTFNVGGPVWAMNWCPVPESHSKEKQYLVVSAHRSLDTFYQIHDHYKVKGLLQFWNFGILERKDARSGKAPTFDLGIAHDFGPIWQAAWCPNGTWQSPTTATESGSLDRLGLLALACGDGLVRIISVPHPDKLFAVLHNQPEVNGADATITTQNNGGDRQFTKVIVSVKSHVELVPTPAGVTHEGQLGQAFCTEWSLDSMHQKIAAGYSDGSLCVWNLANQSALLKSSRTDDGLTTRLSPYIRIKATVTVIRDLAWCPVDSNFIITGSKERSMKVWNLKSILSPVFDIKKTFTNEITWPYCFCVWLFCEDELFIRNASVRMCNLATFESRALYYHGCNVWSLSFTDWINLAASGDAAGEVTVSKVTSNGAPSLSIFKTRLEDIVENDSQETGGDMAAEISTVEDTELKSAAEVSKETKGEVTIEDVTKRCRIVFEDRNELQFDEKVTLSRSDMKRKQNAIRYDIPHLQSVHKVRWNPNKQAMAWLASGGAAGLVRVHQVKQMWR